MVEVEVEVKVENEIKTEAGCFGIKFLIPDPLFLIPNSDLYFAAHLLRYRRDLWR